MANMTFKANLLPNSNLGYNLGSSNLKWNVYGDLKGNADTATKISSTPNNTNTFLRGDNTWSANLEGDFTTSKGSIWAGTNGDTTAERDIGVRAGGGQIYLYSSASATGGKGLYISAHGTGSGKTVIGVDNDNNVTFYGTLSGNASTATKLSNTPNNMNTFLRGDNTWSNTMEGEAPYWTIKTNNESNYAVLRFATLNKSEAAVLFLNAPSRTGDGGANMLTLRNNVGNLRLNNNTINTGLFTISDTSLNTSYNLYVNGTAKINTSVFSGLFIYDWKGSSNLPMLVLRDAENYGIRYHEGDPDKMMISASGNANSVNADLCINGAGDGTVTIRGLTIFHTGNNLFRGVSFYSGQSNSQEHNCNNITYNGHFYYTSNGPSGLGELSTDGSLYTQAYSSDWVTQIAADYRTGKLYVRSKKNGTWLSWLKTWYKGESVTGAVWNDYAEYREAETIKPGYILCEKGDGSLYKSTKRCQEFAGVSSDTWGFAQGETEKAKTPIAVSGRVLVYVKDKVKVNDYICSGPDGIGLKMHWWEKILYPHRVVGIVSEIPTYEKWGGGDGADRDPVDVNGRIWIKCCN